MPFGSAEGVFVRRLDDGAGRGARGRGKRILRARAAPGSARGALGPPRQELADGACAMLGALRKRGRCRKTPQVERREARSRDRKRGRHASQACLGRLSPAAHRRLAQSLRVSRRSASLTGGSAKVKKTGVPRASTKNRGDDACLGAYRASPACAWLPLARAAHSFPNTASTSATCAANPTVKASVRKTGMPRV